MPKVLKPIFTLLFLLATANTLAATYSYSYAFGNGKLVSGTVDGIANGNLVTDLTNITANINGVPFAGNGSLRDWHRDNTNASLVQGGGVISFNGAQNNFIFMNSENVLDFFCCITGNRVPYFFSTSNQQYTWFEVRNEGQYYPMGEQYEFSVLKWSLREVATVDEPQTYALLLAGLGMIAFAARRKSGPKTEANAGN